jgi:acyl carrier protein
VALYKQVFPSTCILFNGLATTETGTEFRRYFIDQTTPIGEPRVPVGYAVEGTEVLVLDESGRAVDDDCEGEIVVKSRYLSPGYWQRPALTREKFRPDANGGEERLYYTGDVGVRRSDGCLLHLGRKDFQVQIKGHRIEVAEVEAALLAIPAIEEAVVVARADELGELRLVAYVVSAGQAAPTVSALRRALQTCLPSSMIPDSFVSLEALPRTPAGKIDRQALPAPDQVRPHLDVPFARARTPIEEIVATIWAEVLNLDRVGVLDQFLDLGGHSLLATQIGARIVRTFGVELPVRTLFDTPTVADMAVVIAQCADQVVQDRRLAEDRGRG